MSCKKEDLNLTGNSGCCGGFSNTAMDECDLIHLETVEDQVRTLAYEKWEAAGYPEGDGTEFWFQAEKEFFNKAE